MITDAIKTILNNNNYLRFKFISLIYICLNFADFLKIYSALIIGISEYMAYQSVHYYDIDRYFSDHIRELVKEKREAEKRIDIWMTRLISQIHDHAKEQRQLLDTYYRERLSTLQETRDEMRETTRTYYFKNQYEKMVKLVELLKNLKFELFIACEEEDRSLPFMYYMRQEEFEQKKKQNSSSSKKGNSKFETPTGSTNDRYPDSNREARAGSSYNPKSGIEEQKK